MKILLSILIFLVILFPKNVTAQEELQTQNLDILKTIVASGLMGDYNNISINENWIDIPCSELSDSFCVRIDYTPGNAGFGGIYWLNLEAIHMKNSWRSTRR